MHLTLTTFFIFCAAIASVPSFPFAAAFSEHEISPTQGLPAATTIHNSRRHASAANDRVTLEYPSEIEVHQSQGQAGRLLPRFGPQYDGNKPAAGQLWRTVESMQAWFNGKISHGHPGQDAPVSRLKMIKADISIAKNNARITQMSNVRFYAEAAINPDVPAISVLFYISEAQPNDEEPYHLQPANARFHNEYGTLRVHAVRNALSLDQAVQDAAQRLNKDCASFRKDFSVVWIYLDPKRSFLPELQISYAFPVAKCGIKRIVIQGGGGFRYETGPNGITPENDENNQPAGENSKPNRRPQPAPQNPGPWAPPSVSRRPAVPQGADRQPNERQPEPPFAPWGGAFMQPFARQGNSRRPADPQSRNRAGTSQNARRPSGPPNGGPLPLAGRPPNS